MLAYGLLAGWRLNEEAGNTRLDVLGVAAMAELNGTVLSAPGKVGNAASFAADTHFLQYASALVTSGSFSMAAWAKWVSGGTTNAILWQSTGGTLRQFLAINSSTGVPGYGVSGANSGDGIAKPGSWTHMALVYDATVSMFATYQDGVQLATHNIAANFAGVNLTQIGTATSNISVDEAYVWGRALNNAEIAQLYAAGNAGLSYPWTDGRSFS